jgi:hypothetical protein
MAGYMRCAVVGSRKYTNQPAVVNFVVKAIDAGWQIVTGGAEGVDTFAEDASMGYGHFTVVIKPKWHGPEGKGAYNHRAALERNTEIVDLSDMLVAFWDGVSTGTRDSIRKAVEKKIPTFVFDQTGTITEMYMNGEQLL